MRVVVVSGYFDPIGVQHVLLIEDAIKRFIQDDDDLLVAGVNSDECTRRKKGQPPFQDFETRQRIVSSIRGVDRAIGFPDDDGSAIGLLETLLDEYPDAEIVFCNGGDRAPDQDACPEESFAADKDRVRMEYGVGGYHKAASSSDNLRNWVNHTMERYDQEFRLRKKY